MNKRDTDRTRELPFPGSERNPGEDLTEAGQQQRLDQSGEVRIILPENRQTSEEKGGTCSSNDPARGMKTRFIHQIANPTTNNPTTLAIAPPMIASRASTLRGSSTG
jgi:hypothetical protein